MNMFPPKNSPTAAFQPGRRGFLSGSMVPRMADVPHALVAWQVLAPAPAATKAAEVHCDRGHFSYSPRRLRPGRFFCPLALKNPLIL